jgi:hypothetical protein
MEQLTEEDKQQRSSSRAFEDGNENGIPLIGYDPTNNDA